MSHETVSNIISFLIWILPLVISFGGLFLQMYDAKKAKLTFVVSAIISEIVVTHWAYTSPHGIVLVSAVWLLATFLTVVFTVCLCVYASNKQRGKVQLQNENKAIELPLEKTRIEETANLLSEQSKNFDIIFKNLNVHRNPYVSNPFVNNKDFCDYVRVLRVQIKNDSNEVIENVKIKLENVSTKKLGETPFSFTTNPEDETKIDELFLSDIKPSYANFAMQSNKDRQKVVLCVFSDVIEKRDIFGLEFDLVATSKGRSICSKRFTLYLDDEERLQLEKIQE